MDNQYYIYLTTNLVDNKKYIGKHTGPLDDDYLGSGINIKNAIKKYGKENFKKEIIAIVNNEEELNKAEKYYISLYNAVEDPNFYNIADGGQGGNTMKGFSLEKKKEIYQKRSLEYSGEKHPMYNKHHTEETKEKLRQASNSYWTEEKRQERSIKYSGMGNPMYGKKQTQESIEKRIAHTDFSAYRTEEYREKMSKSTSGEKNGNYGNKGIKAKNGKHILMYDENNNLIKEFNTKQMVLEYLKIKGHTALDKAIKNNTIYKGCYWKQI